MTQYPIFIKGERARPPEDVAGIWGYENFLEAIADPTHEEHEHYAEWGAGHDSEAFDAEAANERMQGGR